MVWTVTGGAPWWTLGSAIITGFATAVVYETKKQQFKEARSKRNRDHALSLVSDKVDDHINTLQRKRRTLIRPGDYGEVIDDQWKKEIRHFIEATVPSEVYDYLELDRKNADPILVDYIDACVEQHAYADASDTPDHDISTIDGIEYETLCAELLEDAGWNVKRTQTTGDNGIDLIAESDQRTVAIQCKRYSSPVGNKAVQEAYSGMAYVEADEAAVVTNARFTESAKSLGNKLSVKLLHHEQLDTL
jgi:hypothetical protein